MTGPRRGLRERLAPEVVAALLAAFLGALVVAGVLAVGSRLDGGLTASPTPDLTASRPPVPEYGATARLLSTLNRRLLANRSALAAELAAPPIETDALVATIRQVNSTALFARDRAVLLRRMSGAETIAADLEVYYSRITELGETALGLSQQRQDLYVEASEALVEVLGELPALDDRLTALLIVAKASPIPAPSSSRSPTPAPTPSAPPSLAASPSASPEPPSPGPGDSNLLANGGFEDSSSSPWQLRIAEGSGASISLDGAAPYEGAQSARIDIAAAGDARTAIALRQEGLSLDAAGRYEVAAAIRAATAREVRIRLVGAGGETYGTRLYVAGPAWQLVEFELSVFLSDTAAAVEIDLGRFEATTWVDDVAVRRTAP